MSHLNGESLNIEDQNIEKLLALFPEVNTDGKIDFEKLKQILGDYVDDSEERYRFVWNGKGEALRLSQTPSMGTLRPAKEEGESKNWDETGNLYIEGDNLEVLKLLQKSYFNRVKMIYIDPPYNTGGDFVYKDNFKDNIQNYKKITGQVDSEGNATTTNREYSGRYHTDWLNMMYPRLRLARNLLTDEGVIFISIDDHEVHNLKKICDEIFGEDNFIASFVWKRRASSAMADKLVSKDHEYLLSYQKGNFSSFSGIEKDFRNFINPDNDPRGVWTKGDLTVGMTREQRPNQFYNIIDPKTGLSYKPNPQRVWSYIKDSMDKLIEENRIYFPSDPNQRPMFKRFKQDMNINVNPISTWINENSKLVDKKEVTQLYTGLNSEGTRVIQNIFEFKVFDHPKPLSLLKSIIKQSTEKDDIILDFFAGSSTTAHAIMELNSEDGFDRRFIMVQLPEPTNEKSEAYRAGFKNIAEIGRERIRRAGDKIKEELKKKYEAASDEERKQMKHPDELDIGFKVFKLDSSNIKEWNPGKYENIQQAIEDALTPYVPDRTEEDVVYEMMLKMGLDLTYPVEEIDVNGKTIYSIGYGFLMICLADKVDIVVAEKMIEIKDENNQQEFRAIFRDEGFSSDTDKTNVKETLRSAGLAEESFITL